ncbi:unnamed protein product, partial [Ixodes persulcatus]
DSDDASDDGTTEDPYWTEVCKKAHQHHMGITIVADTAFRNEQAEAGYDQHLYLKTFVDTTEDEMIFEIFKNTTKSSGRSLDPHLTLGMFREWATNQSFFNNSDVAYLITSHKIFDFVMAYRLEMKAASYAFGVCSRRRVALSSDDGKTFSGVPAAVQQIANLFLLQLLGFEWDDKRSKQGCTPQDGHVMSRNGEATPHPTFSECSKDSWDEQIQMSLSGSPCYKLNMSWPTSERTTPYTFFNCKEPCKNITEESDNNILNKQSEVNQRSKNMDICKINCCPDYNNHFHGTKNGAPDGMPCGPLQVCLQQVCVKVPEQRSEISTVLTESDT